MSWPVSQAVVWKEVTFPDHGAVAMLRLDSSSLYTSDLGGWTLGFSAAGLGVVTGGRGEEEGATTGGRSEDEGATTSGDTAGFCGSLFLGTVSTAAAVFVLTEATGGCCTAAWEATAACRGEEVGATTVGCLTTGAGFCTAEGWSQALEALTPTGSIFLWFFKSSSSLSSLLPFFGAVDAAAVFDGIEEDWGEGIMYFFGGYLGRSNRLMR